MPSVPSTELHTIATLTLYLTNHKLLRFTDLYEYESVLFMYDFVESNLPRSFGDFFAIIVMCKTSTEPANKT